MQMGETPGFLYQERNKKNQDCLSMADKAQEILEAAAGIVREEIKCLIPP